MGYDHNPFNPKKGWSSELQIGFGTWVGRVETIGFGTLVAGQRLSVFGTLVGWVETIRPWRLGGLGRD